MKALGRAFRWQGERGRDRERERIIPGSHAEDTACVNKQESGRKGIILELKKWGRSLGHVFAAREERFRVKTDVVILMQKPCSREISPLSKPRHPSTSSLCLKHY